MHPHDAGGAASGVDRRALGRKRAGVREHGARRGLRALDRQQQHRLAGARRRLARGRERAPVAEVLDVDGDQLGRGVPGQLADQLRDLHVGLVADRDEAREAQPGALGEHPDLEREVAALGDQPDRAAREVVRHEIELRAGVEHAEAVRAEQDRPGGARPLGERAVARAAGIAVGRARRDHDDGARAGRERVVERRLERRRRHREHREAGRFGQLAERGVRRPAEDLAGAPVDQVHAPPRLPAQRAAREPVAPLDGVVGRADDRHGVRVEEGGEVARGGRAAGRAVGRASRAAGRAVGRASRAAARACHAASTGGGGSPSPHASAPPSTTIVVPVTYAPPAEARNAITPATSSGRPSRPSGTLRVQPSIASGP